MIHYNSRDINHKKPYGAVETGASVNFNVFLTDCGEAALVIKKENCQSETLTGNGFEGGCSFEWQAGEAGLYFYYFTAACGDGSEEKTDTYQLTVYEHADEGVPEWLSSGLMYQIFPDRFAKSDNYTAPFQRKRHMIHEKWGELPVHGPDENGIVWNDDFFGGNLAGIIENLDYLSELGVTVIYLNPVFEAFSNHRYDTGDYHKIDPMLGTEEDFKRLCAEAGKKGMKVVFDGVFNHTGVNSVYFNKYGNYPGKGAYQSMESPYYSWYNFIYYPEEYESWWGIDTLPQVNEDDESFLDFTIRNDDSVIRHWLRAGACGLRLDVVDELPDKFLDELRIVVKEEKKDAMIIGEVWEDASNKESYGERRRYLLGRQLDSVMNYPLKDAIIRYIGYDNNAEAFFDSIERLRENYPAHIFNALMNFLGTHDTKRILTVFSECSATYEEARQKLFSALLIWAFMPGIPCIYYGDEIGMAGGADPLNRQCFCPELKNNEINMYFKRLLSFKKKIKDINKMEYIPGEAAGGYFSFERRGGKESLHVAVNNGDEVKMFDTGDGKAIDFVISGRVDYLGDNIFEMHGKSGIAVLTNR